MASVLAAVLGLIGLGTAAHAQTTLPPETVWGRIGAGQSGPPEAIPFATLFSYFTGTITVVNGVTYPASGNAGGILYFSNSSTVASTGTLAQYGFVIGGGSLAAPSTITACTDAQVPIGQSAAAPSCETIGGDATLSDSGSVTISNNAVTNAKSAQMAAATFKGNPTASTANVQDVSINSLSADSSPDANNDYLFIWNHTTGTLQKINPGTIASAAVAGVATLNGQTGSVNIVPGLGIKVTATSGNVSVGENGAAFLPITTITGAL